MKWVQDHQDLEIDDKKIKVQLTGKLHIDIPKVYRNILQYVGSIISQYIACPYSSNTGLSALTGHYPVQDKK